MNTTNTTVFGITITLSDGTTGDCDLVVGADGIHSKVRDLVFDDWQVEDTETAVWSFWVPDSDVSAGFTEMWGAGGRAFLVAPIADRHMAPLAMPLENRSHWRGDVTLGEDSCKVATGHAPLQ